MTTRDFDPIIAGIDGARGVIDGRTGEKQCRVRDLAACYADEAAFASFAAAHGDDVAYVVHEIRPERAEPYDLISGTSTLEPGRVGREFFMTRGHIHAHADRPEVYFCLRGRGVMHLETLGGKTAPVALAPGSLAYVPPYWVHRSVNVGDEPLITLFCYPADAGQDYDIIGRAGGMRTLIVDDGTGGWAEAPNPRYRPRAPAEQRRYRER